MEGENEGVRRIYSLPAWIRTARREPPSLDTPLFMLLLPSLLSSCLFRLSLLPELGWINKETPTNSSIENSAILFSRFSPKLYLFLLPSFSFLYLSRSLFLFPILPGLTRRLSSFQRIREHRYSRSTPISGGIAADGKQPNFSWSSESLVLIGLPLERSFVFWIIFFSTSISRGRKFILFFRINEKINSAAELNRTLCSHCNHF